MFCMFYTAKRFLHRGLSSCILKADGGALPRRPRQVPSRHDEGDRDEDYDARQEM